MTQNEYGQYEVPSGSKLGRVLRGLDPEYALSELTRLQNQQVVDKDRARRIMEARYGLLNGQPETLSDLASRYGVTIERIRTIEISSLIKLNKIRSGVSPERVFERSSIPWIDNAFLLTKQALVHHRRQIAKPKYEYPTE